MLSGEVFLILRFILAGILYTFLGWAFWVLWQDLRRQSSSSSVEHIPPLVLSYKEEYEEETFRFVVPRVVVGRDPACDGQVGDSTISARHARLSFHHNQWWAEDLDSLNGTFLNEAPVEKPLVITTGDQLRCGQVVFSIKIET